MNDAFRCSTKRPRWMDYERPAILSICYWRYWERRAEASFHSSVIALSSKNLFTASSFLKLAESQSMDPFVEHLLLLLCSIVFFLRIRSSIARSKQKKWSYQVNYPWSWIFCHSVSENLQSTKNWAGSTNNYTRWFIMTWSFARDLQNGWLTLYNRNEFPLTFRDLGFPAPDWVHQEETKHDRITLHALTRRRWAYLYRISRENKH